MTETQKLHSVSYWSNRHKSINTFDENYHEHTLIDGVFTSIDTNQIQEHRSLQNFICSKTEHISYYEHQPFWNSMVSCVWPSTTFCFAKDLMVSLSECFFKWKLLPKPSSSWTNQRGPHAVLGSSLQLISDRSNVQRRKFTSSMVQVSKIAPE
jgi:hypothetical protein